MPKTKLWTTNFTDGELDVRQDVYTVSETGWGISVTQPGGGWHGLNSWLYARMFGDTPHSVIANRRKVLNTNGDHEAPEDIYGAGKISDSVE